MSGSRKSFIETNACDAVVIKALQIFLSNHLNHTIPNNCVSVKSRKGLKKAVRKAASWSKEYNYFYKSDIKDYYRSINHEILYRALFEKIRDKKIQTLISGYCENLVDKNALLETPTKGIVKGGALSVLLGNFYLVPLDLAMKAMKQIRYVRYMDDWLICVKTRSHLKRAIKTV